MLGCSSRDVTAARFIVLTLAQVASSYDAVTDSHCSSRLSLFQLDRGVLVNQRKASSQSLLTSNNTDSTALNGTTGETSTIFIDANASDHSPAHPLDGMFAYVYFRQTGASSLSAVFSERHRRKGLLDETSRLWQGGLCHARSRKVDLEQLPCHDAPGGAVVSANFGYCSRLTTGRPCRYVTLLREPVARIVSAYNYFCLSCAEKNCPPTEFRSSKWCPMISLVEYAAEIGNEYVRQFAGVQAPCLPNGVGCNQSVLHGGGVEDEDDYFKALGSFKQNNILVLFSESLFTAKNGLPLGMATLAAFFHEDFKNFKVPMLHREHKYTPTKHDVDKITNLLKYDLRLYLALRIRSSNATAGHRLTSTESQHLGLREYAQLYLRENPFTEFEEHLLMDESFEAA